MDDYRQYLSDNVLIEDKVITYRMLSRALKVPVNSAKQMLYDFHRVQNGKRPETVHATYLVHGFISQTNEPNAEENSDVDMTGSSPEVDFRGEKVQTKAILLVAEEHLKDALSEFTSVSSIHVYSLSSHRVNDFTVLSEIARQVLDSASGNEDLAITRRTCGAITSPFVRRRQRLDPSAVASTSTVTAVEQENKVAAKSVSLSNTKVKEEPKPSKPAPTDSAKDSTSAQPSQAKKAPGLKHSGSNIMQAFSKTPAAKIKKGENSPHATPRGGESNTRAMSDDGEDDSDMPQPQNEGFDRRNRRKQREEELKRMMDDENDSGGDAEENEEQNHADAPIEEPGEEVNVPVQAPQEELAEVVSTSANGRRRRKRKIMKKKQIQDEEGYLVTVQEPSWESFSEDEAPPVYKNTTSAPTAPAAKPKKGGPKGQGNIMSFFSKK